MATTEGRLQEWWDSLSADERARLLAVDLSEPLPEDLVDLVARARVSTPAVEQGWTEDPEGTTWAHTAPWVRDFLEAKRYE